MGINLLIGEKVKFIDLSALLCPPPKGRETLFLVRILLASALALASA